MPRYKGPLLGYFMINALLLMQLELNVQNVYDLHCV